MCALGEEHTKECDILSRRKDKKIIDDFTEPSKIYWVITTLRCLHWRKKLLKIYTKYFRLRATASCLISHYFFRDTRPLVNSKDFKIDTK